MIFDTLGKKVLSITHGKKKYTVTAKVKELDHGSEVIVGGEVKHTGHMPNGDSFIVIDDGIGELSVRLLPMVVEHFGIPEKDSLVIARGKVVFPTDSEKESEPVVYASTCMHVEGGDE